VATTVEQREDEAPRPVRRDGRRAVGVPEVVFAGLVVVTVVAYVLKTRGYAFSTDDWLFVQRGGSVADYFRPYNLSLAFVPIAVYRVLFAVFGFHTTLPLRLVGITCELSVAVALFLTVRTRVGSALALLVGTSFLWYPNMVLYPSAFDHYIGLTAVVACAWILTQRRPSLDPLLALILVFALGASGVGVAACVGGLVYLALRGAPLRRWLAVAVPLVGWILWWRLVAHTARDAAHRSLGQSRELVVNGIIRSFDGLVGDNRVLGGILIVLFIVALVWTVAHGAQVARAARTGVAGCALAGLRAADHQLAWSAALVTWWVGLAYSRGLYAFAGVFRYQFVGSGLVVLAFLPSRRPARLAALVARPAALWGAVALSALVIAANHASVTRESQGMTKESNRIRANMVQANLGPEVVPDRRRVGLGPGDNPLLPAGLYRSLVARHGVPGGTAPRYPDAAILSLLATRLVPDTGGAIEGCLPMTSTVVVPGGATLRLHAADHPVTVQAHRFEPGWTRIGTIPAGQTVDVALPAGPAPRGWVVAANGACRAVSGH
jgi:hypothetical protein